MKHILLLSFTFCLLSSLQAQNPYIEMSYPWLNISQIKEGKVSKIMLATLGDNGTVQKQLVLSFDKQGLMTREECQIGYKYTNVFHYAENGIMDYCISYDNSKTDTMQFQYVASEKQVVSSTISANNSGDKVMFLRLYQYNENMDMAYITSSSGKLTYRGGSPEYPMSVIDSMAFSRVGNITTIFSQDIFETWTYDESGKLVEQTMKNLLYEISETYEYSYDQHNRLVLITYSQDGVSSKTFVTYEFYQ